MKEQSAEERLIEEIRDDLDWARHCAPETLEENGLLWHVLKAVEAYDREVAGAATT